jgi:hypothetical protein
LEPDALVKASIFNGDTTRSQGESPHREVSVIFAAFVS